MQSKDACGTWLWDTIVLFICNMIAMIHTWFLSLRQLGAGAGEYMCPRCRHARAKEVVTVDCGESALQHWRTTKGSYIGRRKPVRLLAGE